MKKLTKKQIKEEILRVVDLQEKAYWNAERPDSGVFLCLSFIDDELTKQMKAWVKDQGVLVGFSNNVETSHFIMSDIDKEDINSQSCAAIFRTMILIEFAKSLGVKI